MPDLARFGDFAKGIGAVPPVPPPAAGGGTVEEAGKHQRYPPSTEYVPPVPLVPPQNYNAGSETDLFDAHEERAAIMEYDGGLPRYEAEIRAWKEVLGDRA